MNPAITSAVAALLGAVVGGLASLASTWIGERTRYRRTLLQEEIVRRVNTYSDFIERSSPLYVASAMHNITDDQAHIAGMVALYAVSSRIRLFASDPVILEADKVMDFIIAQYGDKNVSAEQLRQNVFENKDGPLKPFCIACRRELKDLEAKF